MKKRLGVFFLIVFTFFSNCFLPQSIFADELSTIEERLLPFLPFTFSYEENGIVMSLTKVPSNGTLYYRQYHDASKAMSFSTLKAGELLYCPYNSTVCVWLEYDDGFKSRARLFYINRPSTTETTSLMQVFSPEPGVWAREPILNISSSANTTVYYSLDGSDPEMSGQIYYQPFRIEKRGNVLLRLKAVSEFGKTEEKSISYQVLSGGSKLDPSFYFFNDLPQVDLNTNKLENESFQVLKPYQILAWNYLEFLLQSSVKYELSTSSVTPLSFPSVAKEYTGPIFLSREEDLYLFYSSPSVEGGAIQKIFLPKKPKLSLTDNKNISNAPVTVSFSDKRFLYTFTVADKFTPTEPSLFSHKFDAEKKTFDVKPGQEAHYNLRIKAFYEGVCQGEFFVDFTLDKKIPPKVDLKFSSERSITNESVTMTLPKKAPNTDYNLVLKITPEAHQLDESTFILEGKSGENTTYLVRAWHEDVAGNIGEIFQKEISVFPYLVYVDSGAKNSGDGSKDAPFSKLEKAFEFIKQQKSRVGEKRNWTIYMTGSFTLSNSLIVSDNIVFRGNDAKVSLQTNIGFVIQNCEVSFSNVVFTRNEVEFDSKVVPIFYASNATLELNNIEFHTKYDGTCVSLYQSSCVFEKVKYNSTQSNYTESFVFSKSEVIIEGFELNLRCNSAVACAFDSSLASIFDSSFSVYSETVCRTLELKNSSINLEKFSSVRLPDVFNKDYCIALDKTSNLRTNEKLNIVGYRYEIKQ